VQRATRCAEGRSTPSATAGCAASAARSKGWHKTFFFGLLKRDGAVYEETAPDYKKAALQAVIRCDRLGFISPYD